MLVYASSKAFPRKTFVISVKSNFTLARVRAHLMHLLYEMGREDHQFRLRFNGQYLKDSLTLEDYDIIDNAVLKMIPMAKDSDSLFDMKSLISEESGEANIGAVNDVQGALNKEVELLNKRQKITGDFHGVMYIHFVGVVCSLVSAYWYSFCWLLPIYILGSYFSPQYSRTSGFTGTYLITPRKYCLIFAVLFLAVSGGSGTLSVLKWLIIYKDGCPDWVFDGDCSHHNVYTAIFFGIHCVTYIVTSCLLVAMFVNYAFKTGDIIEKLLVQTKDLNKVLEAARNGKLKDKRVAAFELASFATSSDDNKFMIVEYHGLDTLISLSLSSDVATQEYAAEALAELLTIKSIQTEFIRIDGVRHLTALLHSRSIRCVHEAVTAVSYIIQESEENKLAVVANQGLDDLSHAAYHDNIPTQRTLAGIFLELTFDKEIRDQLASMNTPAQALIKLCSVNDEEVQRFALQSLELLALESADTVCAQVELIPTLLDTPFKSVDEKILLLAGKILLYFAENKDTCSNILSEGNLYDSLLRYAQTSNPVLQKVVVKIIYCMAEQPNLRILALAVNLDKILLHIKHHATDREAWNMADNGLQVIQSSDDLHSLPRLSAADKVSRMHASHSSLHGSRTSLRSLTSRGDNRPSSAAASQRSIN